jgi:ribosome-binding protein aMBF1 (putative translation factor)
MARAGLDWSVKELATRARVGEATIRRFEHGHATITATAEAISRALQAAGCEFFTESGYVGVQAPPPLAEPGS